MTPRTYSRDDWVAAKETWHGFGPAWNGLRQRAALNGLIFAPAGDEHDDRDAPNPSQRAIVYRALNDNPAALYAIVGRSRSWSDVVDRIFGLEANLREAAGLSEKNAAFDKERDSAGPSTFAAMVEQVVASKGLTQTCPNCGWSPGVEVAS